MAREIYKYRDVIDSREVIERIEVLESDREALEAEIAEWAQEVIEAQAAVDESEGLTGPGAAEGAEEQLETAEVGLSDAKDKLADFDESSEGGELKKLLALADDGENYSDWKRGACLIHDSYFVTYAQETAEDLGLIKRDAHWPNNCIDWSEAADQLKQDYSSIDFDGETYWVR